MYSNLSLHRPNAQSAAPLPSGGAPVPRPAAPVATPGAFSVSASARLAHAAYGATGPVRTPRGTEYSAFQKVTARLSRARSADTALAERAAALTENRRLWMILATDLASDGNALPDPVKARLLYLAEFTFLHGRAALKDPEALGPLIDINSAVMRGLTAEPAPAADVRAPLAPDAGRPS